MHLPPPTPLVTFLKNAYLATDSPVVLTVIVFWVSGNFIIPRSSLERARPYYLSNGMLVCKTKFCFTHTSVWYFRRGKRKYASFTGAKQTAIHKQLELAGAPTGLPGDRGSLFKYFASYQLNTPDPVRSSGHGSCSAAKGRSHQCLRSQESMAQRHDSFNERRQENRLRYRKYIASTLHWREFTFPRPVGPLFKVQDSQRTQRRHYPSHTHKPTLRSRASFFKNYVSKDRLDEPIATLDTFSLPNKKLLLYSWNIETFTGVGKYEQFQSIVTSLPLGFYCLQETKSQNSDVLRYPFLHYYPSGAPSDPHAGVGFAIPTPLLSIVRDFHPWDSRLAVLILNTRPYKISLFTNYAPSQLSDLAQDQKRKDKLWHQLHQLFNHYSSQYIPVLMGDFNARLAPNFTKSLPDLFGSMTFARDIDEDSYPSTNLFHLTEFMSSNELSAVSTMRPRPPGLLVTYQDIVAGPPPPTSPTLDSYAVLDRVICHQEHRSLFRSIRSHTSVALPWRRRRFLISASIRLPSFRAPRRIAPPPKLDFSLTSSKLSFQSQLLLQSDFPSITPSTATPFAVYLDGSCPDQHSVSYSNPAGWGVYFANLDLDFLDLLDLRLFSLKVPITLPNCRHHWRPFHLFFPSLPLVRTFTFTLIHNMLSISSKVYLCPQPTFSLPLSYWIIILIFLPSPPLKLNLTLGFPAMNVPILTLTTESPGALPSVDSLHSPLLLYTFFHLFPLPFRTRKSNYP